MKFLWTTASRKALQKIKERMIDQYENKDINRFKLKFTKKKEFVAVPVTFFGCPAFQLFVNGKEFNTYLFKDKKWKVL